MISSTLINVNLIINKSYKIINLISYMDVLTTGFALCRNLSQNMIIYVTEFEEPLQ